MAERDVVTGAFSYTGGFIARELLARGRVVRTLSRRTEPAHALAEHVEPGTLQFADRDRLVRDLEGADVLYNTYWIRFERAGQTFDAAVANTRTLLEAARAANVRRVVHVSVSNASTASPLPYFRGKARVEQEVAALCPSYAVVRPTLIFGPDDLLVNNIAWILRRFPLFLVPRGPGYRLQPVAGEDVAKIAADAGAQHTSVTVDAAGPETYEFAQLVQLVGRALGARSRVMRAPTGLALALTAVAGRLLRDVIVTREELAGLAANLLLSSEPPRGRKSFADWVEANAPRLGRTYVSELDRNFRRHAPI